MIVDLVPQGVSSQAADTPDAVAVSDGALTLTYGDLDVRASRVADALRGVDAGPDTVIAICLERSIDFVVAALGVLRAGAAYLPWVLDSAAPEMRAKVLDVLPLPARILCRRVWEPRYRRTVPWGDPVSR
jgi:non-ribosomal peptide synthetase component F